MRRENRKKKRVCVFITVVLLAVAIGFSENNIITAASLPRTEFKKTVSDNRVPVETEQKISAEEMLIADKREETETVSGNAAQSDMAEEKADDMSDITALPDGQGTAAVVFPSCLEVAFNPMKLAVSMGDGSYSTKQILSGNHEIVNKGLEDQFVTVSICAEDLNGGQVVFLDSPEAVELAGEDVYAIYLSVFSTKKPSDIKSAEGIEIPLYAGETSFSFEIPAGNAMAFTFGGVMNERANWSKLSGGIRLSVVYTYETVKGNGTMVK